MRLAAALAILASLGCGAGGLELRGPPSAAFDVVVVPGCPSREDGRPSRCQLARALWAAVLWERGWAKEFITSGADVYTPHVEAEALAQIMATLGVPAEHIHLERNAFHTDENMYFSLRIARGLGAHTIAIASTRGHAVWACRMMIDWGQACRALPVDLDAVAARHHAAPSGLIEGLHAPATVAWVPYRERERAIALHTGRHRPPSWMLYPLLGLMRVSGERWVPIVHGEAASITWAERSREIAELAAAGARDATR